MIEANPYHNLSSFIGFRTDDERSAYENISDFNKNWFDRASYPQFKQHEENILRFTQELHNNYFEWGFLTIDSSEAIYCALLFHLLKFRENSIGSEANFVISKFGHVCFKKAAVLLNVEMREVEASDNGEINLDDLKSKIDTKTFCVIGLAGTTELGSYDNIVEMEKICKELNIPFHIDAAIGGFIYPFHQNQKIPSNFQSAASINISGHKYGYARPSVAILLFKNKNSLPKKFYSTSIAYLPGGESEEFGLLGSKSAIGLIDLNFNVLNWGKHGYEKIVSTTFQQKEKLINELKKFKEFKIFDSGDIVVVV